MTASAEDLVLRRLFLGHQDQLRAALGASREAIDHPGLKGAASEAHWRNLLETHLPRRYRVTAGVVVDCRGGQSQQIDVIVHDAHYCPLFLDEQGVSFVPAESVYAVFEAKQELTAAYLLAAGEKAASVRRLYRTSGPILDRGVVKAPRPLPRILGGVLALSPGWVEGLADNFKKALAGLGTEDRLDLGCVLGAGAFEVASDGQLIIAGPEGALVSFFLRLVYRLQAIGTIPAIEWPAYIEAALPPVQTAFPTSTGLRAK